MSWDRVKLALVLDFGFPKETAEKAVQHYFNGGYLTPQECQALEKVHKFDTRIGQTLHYIDVLNHLNYRINH